jgi:hypothetical protein
MNALSETAIIQNVTGEGNPERQMIGMKELKHRLSVILIDEQSSVSGELNISIP